MTLVELQERMTPHELWLWSVFYEYRHQEEQAAMKKARRR
jgi:hypothetical protein